MVIWIGEPAHWSVYADMMHSVRTGKPAWDHVHGEPVFPYLFKTNVELGNIFNRAMASYSHQSIAGVLAAYDFSGVSTIADIAGGLGHLIASILKEYPSSKGVLFDLKEVLTNAPTMLESYGVADRVELVEGDFFKEIPVVADVYLLKHIIHDWYDDNCEMILRNIRNVMPDDGRVLIVDAVIPEGNAPHMGKIMDLEMLISPGGVERTAAEFSSLLDRSGFRLNRIIETPSPMSIVEAVKA
jgi:ubiquinone/menaquinone biosynthesis C-methylase UbiE